MHEHCHNIDTAIKLSGILGIMYEKSFDELLEYISTSQYHSKIQIQATSVEMIKDGITPLSCIISDLVVDFATIFLKNAKFFVVIGDTKQGLYHIRDCH